ncbi:MAG: DNA methyltransferase [Pyrinomonadaceae bacterium]
MALDKSAEETYHELIMAGDEVSTMIESFRSFIGANQMMAYLVMMAVRLKELHRVLKPTGSLYLHCDPTASHYLKILLDTIFGAQNFKNEIIWKRSSAHNDAKQGRRELGRIHDNIYFYAKSQAWTWNTVFTEYGAEYVKSNYRHVDEKTGRMYKSTDLTAAKPGGDTSYEWKGRKPTDGRFWAYSKENMAKFDAEGLLHYSSTGLPRLKQYIDEMPGIALQDLWTDVPPISSQAQERLGYPTQKPVALLERIVAASSNEGDIVLDPFCGCGTTIAAAQKLNRQWIGIDITHLGIALQKYRLKDAFGLEPNVRVTPSGVKPVTQISANPDQVITPKGVTLTYRIIGEPEDLDGAKQLATEDHYQFQWWALSLIKARPLGASSGSKEGKKGSDKGIDGTMVFIDDASNKAKRVIVQVKSGKVKSGDIRDLGHTFERENAAIGVFITLEKPSRDMTSEAVGKGFYHSEGWNRDYPKLQILTIEELLDGKQIDMPQTSITFKQAERMSSAEVDQQRLEF